MTNWASSGGIKIERAKEHIGNLAVAISEFHQTNPYVLIPEEDANTGGLYVRVRIRQTPPLRLGAIAGDAIHNLRAALDILWRIAMRAGPGRRTEFPFNNGPKEFENTHRGAVKGRSKAAMDILQAVKPYKGGNDLLWGLHTADIVDKHHALIPAYSSTHPMLFIDVAEVFKQHSAGTRPPEWGELPSWILGVKGKPMCPVEDGAIIGHVDGRFRPKVDVNLEFALDVTFGEPEILKSKPMVATLTQIAGVVDGLVESFRIARLIE